MRTSSLRDRIRAANSLQELDALEKEGNGYQFASNNTRDKWVVAILVRSAALRLKGGK